MHVNIYFFVGLVHGYLKQFCVQKESISSLSVVVALFMEVTQLVKVPGSEKSNDLWVMTRWVFHTLTDRGLTLPDGCVLTGSSSSNTA